ncbi:hypothetical protein DEJ48_15895 [Streptomyces venezuelae]|uniref:ADP-ribosylglycohydrolase family protein n=1 Tax=Streptomyces venezuelae TaxID=54571 RepID=A0A5P2BXH8_STRVZ|nr:hypothetical protein DEJ48_15895 [Streptomyces venezuelae]
MGDSRALIGGQVRGHAHRRRSYHRRAPLRTGPPAGGAASARIDVPVHVLHGLAGRSGTPGRAGGVHRGGLGRVRGDAGRGGGGAGDRRGARSRGVGAAWTAERVLGAALYAFLASEAHPRHALRRASHTSGASAATAALAGAFAGAHRGPSGWPPEWVEAVKYGERLSRPWAAGGTAPDLPGPDRRKSPYDRSRTGSSVTATAMRSVQSDRVAPIRKQVGRTYLLILVTWPAPTVRPPSRMANFRPSSIATGWMSSTVISVLSPGMTISVPSGRVTTPVTSVVRK